MYTDPKIQESIRKVEAARAENVKLSPARMSAEEKENLLKTFHPDYRENQFTTLRIGPNKGGNAAGGKAQSRAFASASGCAGL